MVARDLPSLRRAYRGMYIKEAASLVGKDRLDSYAEPT